MNLPIIANTYFKQIDAEIKAFRENNIAMTTLDRLMQSITANIPYHEFSVLERVKLSNHILKALTLEERKLLSKNLLQEQVLEQRTLLNHWSTITAQSSQIDTGYIAQHLVSLQTQISGQGMRGKGDDLSDGSEVKSANFLDSLDMKGAVAPRWNFTAINIDIMERFLNYPAIYLLSMDLNKEKSFRTRIWKVDVTKHEVLRQRYIEWMNKLGYPKFNSGEQKSVNFQLFPPRNMTNETFARHGNGRTNGFKRIEIELENTLGSELIFQADEVNNEIIITKF